MNKDIISLEYEQKTNRIKLILQIRHTIMIDPSFALEFADKLMQLAGRVRAHQPKAALPHIKSYKENPNV